MDYFNSNFPEPFKHKTKCLKIYIAKMRMPFAKQQLRGKRAPTYDELSICGIDKGLIFMIDGEKFNSLGVIEEIISFIDSITLSDLNLTQTPDSLKPGSA